MKKIIKYFKRIWNNECQECGLKKIDWRGVNTCYLCDLTPPSVNNIESKYLLNLKRELEESSPNSDTINVIVTELKRRHK